MAESKTDNGSNTRQTARKHKEDFAYTLNHAFTCTLTDWIDPLLGSWSQAHLGDFAASKLCREKKNTPSPLPTTTDIVNNATKKKGNRYLSHVKEWISGELIGDFGAVPITVAVQYCAPNLTRGLGKYVLEPIAGGIFQKSAEKEAKKWAAQNNVEIGSEEFQNRVKETYRYEIEHLPQAAIWTVSSVALNIATQKKILPAISGGKWKNPASSCELLFHKTLGAVTTAGIVFGGRTIFPSTAKKIDKWTHDKIVEPIVEKTVGTTDGNTADLTSREDETPTTYIGPENRNLKSKVRNYGTEGKSL